MGCHSWRDGGKIYTHPIPTFKWVAGTGAPNGTYLVGGSGDKWLVQYMQLNDTGASFDPPIVLAPTGGESTTASSPTRVSSWSAPGEGSA